MLHVLLHHVIELRYDPFWSIILLHFSGRDSSYQSFYWFASEILFDVSMQSLAAKRIFQWKEQIVIRRCSMKNGMFQSNSPCKSAALRPKERNFYDKLTIHYSYHYENDKIMVKLLLSLHFMTMIVLMIKFIVIIFYHCKNGKIKHPKFL